MRSVLGDTEATGRKLRAREWEAVAWVERKDAVHRQRRARHELDVFFFQAEDGIRDLTVTGVQTCALPICGGFLPFYTGRHDNDYRIGGGGSQLKGDFSSYLPRFYYDTVLFNPDMLEFLATKVPASRLMLASDYPFAEKRPVEYVRRAKKISKKDQDAILGANCARVLGISI